MRNYLFSFCILFAAFTLHSREVQLLWDASTESNLTYNIYACSFLMDTNALPATNGVSVLSTNVGTNLTVTLQLPAGIWFFVATAQNSDGLESYPSEQISWTNLPRAKVSGQLNLQGNVRLE